MALKVADPCPHDISEQDVAAHVDGLCPLCLAAEVNRLVKALQDIISANNDFRKGMPETWDGDPLQDAINVAAKLLLGVVGQQRERS